MEASQAWYLGNKYYNFNAGRASSSDQTKSAYQFTQIVWKGSAGKLVGFGIKDKTVIAWYCPAGNAPNDAVTFKANVFKAGNADLCVSDTVNQCYNKK